MVFTLELTDKPKEIIDGSNVFDAIRVWRDFDNITTEFAELETDLMRNKDIGFVNRLKAGSFDEYYLTKRKQEDFLLKNEQLIYDRSQCPQIIKDAF